MAATGSVILRLNVNVTQVGNVGVGEDDLIIFSLPAASLHTDGMGVRITAWGINAFNGNAKEVKLHFGGTEIVPSGAMPTIQSSEWRVTGTVIRTGAATQDAYAEILVNQGISLTGPLGHARITNPSETLSGAITIKCTGEAVANDDIIQHGLLVELIS